MLHASDLYSSIISYMPPGSVWEQSKPQGLFIQKLSEGVVNSFEAATPMIGPCGATPPYPHIHTISIPSAPISSKLASCGFTGQANTMIDTIANSIAGVLAPSIILSVMDGCTPHTHAFTVGVSASSLASNMLPGGLTGEYAFSYVSGIAQGVIMYIANSMQITSVVHPAPHLVE